MSGCLESPSHLFLFGALFTAELEVIGTIRDKNIISDTNKLTGSSLRLLTSSNTASGLTWREFRELLTDES